MAKLSSREVLSLLAQLVVNPDPGATVVVQPYEEEGEEMVVVFTSVYHWMGPISRWTQAVAQEGSRSI